MRRRQFVEGLAAGWLLTQMPSVVLAKKTQPETTKRIIFVLLRGAMDSLHAVVPVFDVHLKSLRAPLVDPIEKQLLPLENGFGLHPALKNCYSWYQQGEFLPIVATASPYRERSHFEAQDLMECGLDHIDHDSGWLARAISHYRGDGIALARSVPMTLRGGRRIAQTWYPSALPDAPELLYERLQSLYQHSPRMLSRLNDGIKTRASMAAEKSRRRKASFVQMATHCGNLLSKSPDICAAMLEFGGWDTHNNQVGRLQQQFTQLDEALAALKISMGNSWRDTVVIIATEFGRTVAVNGTRGTDHGTASALFLTGGAVRGGQVLGRWPGLTEKKLYEGRDLAPTSDIRQWLARVLADHWGMSKDALSSVFPDIAPADISLTKDLLKANA